MNTPRVDWPTALSDITKLGGAVVVACFALWLIIPAALQMGVDDRERFQAQIESLAKKAEAKEASRVVRLEAIERKIDLLLSQKGRHNEMVDD